MTDLLFKPFQKLKKAELDRLAGFFAHRDVLVRGLDKREWSAYRGGCLPYIGAILAGILWVGHGAMGLDRPVGLGLALAAAVLSTSAMVRTVIAGVRSRRLLKRDEGWVGLAWTKREFCYRSMDLNAIVPWSAITSIEHLGEDQGGVLADTLWLHLEGGDKILIEPVEGTFGGRPLTDWTTDISRIWERRKRY